MKNIANNVIGFAIFLIILSAVIGCVYLEYAAYCQRFPNAAWWTFFFQGK